MRNLCRVRGFSATSLLTAAATRVSLARALEDYANRLRDGDILIVSYAGHGGQVADATGDEPDRLDETWCLYDGMMLDDELRLFWAKFAGGVRILIVSDCCHSGTVSRAPVAPEAKAQADWAPPLISRCAPFEQLQQVWGRHRSFYADAALRAREASMPRCQVVLIAACKDEQLSFEQNGQGLFTGALSRSCRDHGYDRSYPALVDKIDAATRHKQNPQLTYDGSTDARFLAGPIFAI